MKQFPPYTSQYNARILFYLVSCHDKTTNQIMKIKCGKLHINEREQSKIKEHHCY